MANTNNNFQVGGGYSVDLAAYHDAVITHRIDECRDKAFNASSTQEDLNVFYNKIKEARDTGKGIVINVSNHASSTLKQSQFYSSGVSSSSRTPFTRINCPTLEPLR